MIAPLHNYHLCASLKYLRFFLDVVIISYNNIMIVSFYLRYVYKFEIAITINY